MKKQLLFVLVLGLAFCVQNASGQAFTFTSGSLTYNENFDGMGATGTAFLTGWTAVRHAGSGTIGQTLTMAVTDGSANSGNVYNTGTTGATERALGSIASGSTVPRFGAFFTNNTGASILSLTMTGTMEQWRSGSNNTVNEVVAFEYSTDATDLLTGTWTAVTNFDLIEKLTSTTAAAAVDGNLQVNQTALNASISLTWATGTNMWIRWSDVDNTGSDGLYCIDNLVMVASTTPTPTLSVTSPSAGAQWRQGSSYPINWTSSNVNTNVKIEFSDNASSGTPTWTTLNPSIAANAGTWTWSVPAGQALSSDCKIRITDIPQTAQALSGTFNIIPPPTQVATLAALRAGTAGTTYTYTGQAVLTFKQTFRNQKYIQDATAAILIDDAAGKITTTYNLGDAITNITGTVAEFGNMTQFTPESDPGPAASTGNTITPEVVSLPQLTANWQNYEAELVRINNVTFTGATGNFVNGTVYPIADAGANTGNFRTTFFDVDYIGTAISQVPLDMVAIPNSRAEGDYLTSRNLADMIILTPVITVTYPNGGQFLQQGTTQNITWTSSNFTGNVKIELTGTNPAIIAASVANTGSYSWSIPAGQTIASDYKVKISDVVDGSPMDESNATFSIVAPYTLPNLVITEIMYNSTGNDEEWVEIYNNTSTAVDMEGYFIVDDDPAHMSNPIVLPAGAIVAPSDYYTVQVATAGAFPFVPDYDGSGKFSFGNTTDQVKLYHKYGQIIDSVKYMDSSPWPTAPDGTGPSLTFCDPSQDNSVATYWSAATEPFVTLQGATIKATPGSGCYVSSNDIMITEIMYNPIDGGNDTIEFIELLNVGSVNVNLKDWYFSKGITYVFPDVTIQPGSYYLIARNAASMQATFGITCSEWTEGFLDDAGEPIVLKDAIGVVKDSVFYLPTPPWPAEANNGGPSLTFCNTMLDNALGENWSASANQVAVNGLGQAIYASPGATCSSGANIVISEIMYNSPETGTDSLEFIELYNAGNTLNMQGFAFTSGVDFVFPSVSFPTNSYLLVAYNASAIQNTLGKTALQWTSGGLNNAGETITLKDNYGAIIDEVTYADSAPWDTAADGHGPSLTLCDLTSNNSLAINWTASIEFAAVNAAGDSIFATPLGGCVNPPAIANFEGTPTFVIEGGMVQFTDLSANNPIAWEWTFDGGTPSSSTDQNPMVQYLLPGVYSVTLKATNLYGNNTLTKTDYITVGVDGISFNSSAFNVYPNPTEGKVTFTNSSGREQEISIYSMMGKQYLNFTTAADSYDVNLSGLSAGVYMVRIVDTLSKKMQHLKIVLK